MANQKNYCQILVRRNGSDVTQIAEECSELWAVSLEYKKQRKARKDVYRNYNEFLIKEL